MKLGEKFPEGGVGESWTDQCVDASYFEETCLILSHLFSFVSDNHDEIQSHCLGRRGSVPCISEGQDPERI